MSIKATKDEVKKVVKEEYYKRLIENERKELKNLVEFAKSEEMTRDGAERLRDLAFEIAKKLCREIEQVSMSNQLPDQKLLSSVIDQAKLQMKNKD